jgi:hypothetical protein
MEFNLATVTHAKSQAKIGKAKIGKIKVQGQPRQKLARPYLKLGAGSYTCHPAVIGRITVPGQPSKKVYDSTSTEKSWA